uniref:Protein Vpu n=1 Tax=Human immunodeficiency virus type 1 TaxID=11676 RepID=K0H7F9_HV1|nr:vpu protein [Human immunodeficiency virus 1]
MTPLEISAIVGLIVALILAIVVWTIVALEVRNTKAKKNRQVS